jgi:hypothetical protein
MPDSLSEFIVDVLFVEAQFVQHAHEESVLFLRVVLALVCTVLDSQLVEGCSVSCHLGGQKREGNYSTDHRGKSIHSAFPEVL